MLRTIVRSENLLKGTLKQASRGNVIRCLSYECTKLISSKKQILNNTSVLTKQPLAMCKTEYYRGYCSNLPSHTKVTLPALSPTMESGSIVSWEKKEGDKLNEGDLLAEIETDKATMGFETPEEGYLAKILIPAGTKDVAIGKLVCIIVENESDIAAFKDFKDTGAAAPAKKSAPTAAATPTPPPPPPTPVVAPTPIPQPIQQTATVPTPAAAAASGRVYVSPMAKKLAEVQQLRLEGKGSGMFGSITSKDLAGMSARQAGAAQPSAASTTIPAGAAFVDIPVSGTRAVIAKRLTESKTTIPHYYLTVDINMQEITKLRAKFNKSLEKDGVKLSVNDFVIKACALACKKVPEANSSWMGSFIRMYDSVDLSVAVNTEKGLITPIVTQADRKGLVDINKMVKLLAGKARDNKLQPHEFQGGTITVSNLGMFGVTQFCAVINPPQSCILAVGTTQHRLIKDNDSEKGFRECEFMAVTLSCDHRSVDGAVGARWLQYFQKFMEDPHTMIL